MSEPDDRRAGILPPDAPIAPGPDLAAALIAESAALKREIAGLRATLADRDAFLASVAHELRNPMTPILGQVERMLAAAERAEPPVPERLAQGLARLRWLVERYIRRATTVLDVSRAQTGRLALAAGPVRLAEVVREVVEGLEPLAVHAGSPITVAVPDDLVLSCERVALDQILDNLLTNAIKYGDAGPIAVEAVRSGTDALIRVRDRGVGIAPTDQARIFERFERAAGDDPAVRSGFGVGLWLVRRLAEAMNGRVTLRSRAGDGSTFTVTLPLHP
ncbi:Alkaline phosphatase synthesis sensor protein PhoR [Methylobacterium crusticola]|uniref:histidine kinase n=1 Tax=Methylobacterium crusticola TaxID=1697972 RepID=A0ABQ4QUT7_9HYPH|nr:HAMP domain-containing sensor histidine kinase [Methylobacterium crusticola]GJD48535.1 Alkaline phosphatase synthesis sensor protein PhoR [Methylobacterium crusticola]